MATNDYLNVYLQRIRGLSVEVEIHIHEKNRQLVQGYKTVDSPPLKSGVAAMLFISQGVVKCYYDAMHQIWMNLLNTAENHYSKSPPGKN